MTGPEISPEQAVRVLRILGEWNKRGFCYDVQSRTNHGKFFATVDYTDPLHPIPGCELRAEGVDHFHALCQATTVMQIFLEEDRTRHIHSTE